jgi:hypothetical protein
MEAAAFDSESFQNRVQVAAQNVALAERLPTARTEDVSALAVTDEAGKQLSHIRVEISDAIGVRSLWCLSIASPNGLLYLDAMAVEVTDFKTEHFTGAKTRRSIEDEKHSDFRLDCRNNLGDLLPNKGGSALLRASTTGASMNSAFHFIG